MRNGKKARVANCINCTKVSSRCHGPEIELDVVGLSIYPNLYSQIGKFAQNDEGNIKFNNEMSTAKLNVHPINVIFHLMV